MEYEYATGLLGIWPMLLFIGVAIIVIVGMIVDWARTHKYHDTAQKAAEHWYDDSE